MHASRSLGLPCTVVVPLSTAPLMVEKLRAAGAHEVVQYGAAWADADRYLRGEVMPQVGLSWSLLLRVHGQFDEVSGVRGKEGKGMMHRCVDEATSVDVRGGNILTPRPPRPPSPMIPSVILGI